MIHINFALADYLKYLNMTKHKNNFSPPLALGYT